MNEIVASFIVVYFVSFKELWEHIGECENERVREMCKFFYSFEHVEADIYAVYNSVMLAHQQMFAFNYEKKKGKGLPILARISKIQDITLKMVDIDLFRHLKLLNVEFQPFMIRWIKCMFTREFDLYETFKIWDSIFLDYYQNPANNDFALIDGICISMICFIRKDIME